MKLFSSAVLLFSLLTCIGQEVTELSYECLDDPRKGGRVFQPEVLEDSLQMTIKTRGPCNARLAVEVVELSEDKVIGFVVTDLDQVYQGGKLECGCHYRLQFTVVDYKHPEHFMGWVIDNQTVPKDVWETWYWNNRD